jgi:hypothetical protein
MNELRKLLQKKVIFHCSPRGASKGSSDFEVIHTINPPLENRECPGVSDVR